jgi:membrane protease YdiL (CAAX protease family)
VTTNEPSIQQQSLPEQPLGDSEAVKFKTPGPIDPDNPAWTHFLDHEGSSLLNRILGFFVAIVVWFASVVCLILVPLILVAPYVVYRYMNGPLRPEEMAGDKMFIFLSILGVIPAHLVTLLIVWAVVSRWGRYPFWKSVGLSAPQNVGLGTTIALSGGLAVVLLVIGGVVTSWYGGEKTQLDQLINSSYQARLATAFLAFATGPLIEELVYRGVLYPAFARVVGVVGAVVLVSIMFAGVHVLQYKNNLAVIGVILMLSIALTLVRAYSHYLLPSFIIHLIFNGLQSLYLIVQPLIEKSDQTTPPATPAIIFLARTLNHLM